MALARATHPHCTTPSGFEPTSVKLFSFFFWQSGAQNAAWIAHCSNKLRVACLGNIRSMSYTIFRGSNIPTVAIYFFNLIFFLSCFGSSSTSSNLFLYTVSLMHSCCALRSDWYKTSILYIPWIITRPPPPLDSTIQISHFVRFQTVGAS